MNFTLLTYSMVTLIYGRVYCKVDGVAALVWLRSYCPFLVSRALVTTSSLCLLDLLSFLLARIHQYHKPQKVLLE
jgi:hypothetical protein